MREFDIDHGIILEVLKDRLDWNQVKKGSTWRLPEQIGSFWNQSTKHVYKKDLAKMNQHRLICNYHVMINDLNRAIFDENYRGQYPPLTRKSRIQIERNPLVQPGKGYRNIIDYYLDDGLMGAPRYAKLHEATIGEVLDEMAIMGQYSI